MVEQVIPLHAALPLSEVLSLMEREARAMRLQTIIKSAERMRYFVPPVLPADAREWSCI